MSVPVGISGSRSAAVLNQSQWQTPVEVWLQIMESTEPGFCEKNNYVLPVFDGNASTRYGSAFESIIIELTEKKYGQKITDREKFYQCDHLSCHIDGIMGDCLIENKTTTMYSYREEWGDEGTDLIPVNYQLQIQHNLYLSGLEKCILPVLIFPRRPDEFEGDGMTPDIANIQAWGAALAEMGFLKFYEIHANNVLQDKMIAAYSDWWSKHVIGRTPPDPVSYDDIKSLCRSPRGTIIAPDEIERLISEYKNIGEEISASGPLAKRREQVKVEILNFMRSAGFTDDDESQDKWILRGQDGRKLASYGKNKNGIFMFR
jgi:hypothetical protein